MPLPAPLDRLYYEELVALDRMIWAYVEESKKAASPEPLPFGWGVGH